MKKIRRILSAVMALIITLTGMPGLHASGSYAASALTKHTFSDNDPGRAPDNARKLKLGWSNLTSAERGQGVTAVLNPESGYHGYTVKRREDHKYEEPLTLTFEKCGEVMGRETRVVVKIDYVETKSSVSSRQDKFDSDRLTFCYLDKNNFWIGAGTARGKWEHYLYDGPMYVRYTMRVYPMKKDGSGYSNTALKYPFAVGIYDLDRVKLDGKCVEAASVSKDFTDYWVWPNFNTFRKVGVEERSDSVRFYAREEWSASGEKEEKTMAGLIAVSSKESASLSVKHQVGGDMTSQVIPYKLVNSGEFGVQKTSADTDVTGEAPGAGRYNFKGITYSVYENTGTDRNPAKGSRLGIDIVLNSYGRGCNPETWKAAVYEVPEGKYVLQENPESEWASVNGETNKWYKRNTELIPFTVKAGQSASYNTDDYSKGTNIVGVTKVGGTAATIRDEPSMPGLVSLTKRITSTDGNPPDEPEVLSLLTFTLRKSSTGKNIQTISPGQYYDASDKSTGETGDPGCFEFRNLQPGEYIIAENAASLQAAEEKARELGFRGSFSRSGLKELKVTVSGSGTRVTDPSGNKAGEYINTWVPEGDVPDDPEPVPDPGNAKIRIIKREMTPEGPGSNISGIEFTLYDSSGAKIAAGRTDQDGELIFDNLSAGTYVAEETGFDAGKYTSNRTPIPGYSLPSVLVTVGETGIVTAPVFINSEEPEADDFTVKIIKKPDENISGGMSGYYMTGIRYDVYEDAECRVKAGTVTLEQENTNPPQGRGEIVVRMDPPPEYMTFYVKEAYVPPGSGYIEDKDTVYMVNVPPGGSGTVYAADSLRKGSLEFDKVIECSSDGTEVPSPESVVFELKSADDPSLKYYASPDAGGHVSFGNNLYIGDYILTETETGAGDGGTMINVTGGELVHIGTGINSINEDNLWINEWIPDTPPTGRYTVRIEKSSSEYTGSLPSYNMSGIRYSVYRDAGLSEKLGDAELSGNGSSASGRVTLEVSDPQDVMHIYVKETYVPDGANFRKDETVYEADAVLGGVVTVRDGDSCLTDEPEKGSLKFSKVIVNEGDGETPSPDRLVFILESSENPAVTYEAAVSADGKVDFGNDILIGDYVLREKGLAGYKGGRMTDVTGPLEVRIDKGVNRINETGEWKNIWTPDRVPVRFSLKLTKRSSEHIGLTSYSLDGIRYSVYTEPSCDGDSRAADIVLQGDADEAVGTADFTVYGAEDSMKFYVRESYVPDDSGFKKDETVYEVTGRKNETCEVKTPDGGDLTDEPERAALSFTKVISCSEPDAAVPSPEKLTFTLTNTDDPDIRYEASPGADGRVSFKDVLIGRYYLTESGRKLYADGLMADITGQQTLILKKGDNVLGTEGNVYENRWIPDQEKGGIDIVKEVRGNGYIADKSVFRVTVTNTGTGAMVADRERFSRNGILIIDGLEAGTYKIHEELTDEQLRMYRQPEDVLVTVPENATCHVTAELVNETRTSVIRVVKKSSDGMVSNIGFKLTGYTAEGIETEEVSCSTHREIISGETVGVAVFTDVRPGRYVIEETAPDGAGYASTHHVDGFTNPAQRVTTDGINPETLTFINIPLSFSLRKTEELEDGTQTSSPVEGAGYTLYRISDAGQVPASDDELDACMSYTFYTDEEGRIETNALEEGTYWVFESEVPRGYADKEVLPPGFASTARGSYAGSFTLDAENPSAVINDSNRREYGSVILDKTDDAGNPVQGAELALFSDPLCLIVARNRDDTEMRVRTDRFGSIMINNGGKYESFFSGLKWGTYYLKETEAPMGYIRNEEVIRIDIGKDCLVYEASTPGMGTYVNERSRGSVVLTKLDAEDRNTPLDGAKYDLYTSDGIQVGTDLVTGLDNDGDGEADGSGRILVRGLSWGSYYFQETGAPDGYSINSGPVRFTINRFTPSDEPLVVKAYDSPSPAEIVVTIKIRAEDYWKDHGNPVFFGVLTGSDGRVYRKPVIFNERSIREADAEGYVSRSVTFPVTALRDYNVTSEKADRYVLDRDYMGGTQPGPVTDLEELKADESYTDHDADLNVPSGHTGRATFVYIKKDWKDYGDQTGINNIIRKEKSFTGLTAVMTSEEAEAGQRFEPSMLRVYAVFDDGSTREMEASEYIVTGPSPGSDILTRFPYAEGDYTYIVTGTIKGETRKGSFTARVLPPVKLRLYFHTGGAPSDNHISGKSGTDTCSIDNIDADYIDIWKYQETGMIDPSRYNIEWTGHTLTGWFRDPEKMEGGIDQSLEVTEDMHFTAVWDRAVYRIIYHTDTPDPSVRISNKPADQRKLTGQSIELSDKEPSADKGYEFLGWSDSPGGSSEEDVMHAYDPGSLYTADANINLYAVWKPHSAALRYHANDEEYSSMLPAGGMPADSVLMYGSARTAPPAPSRAGFRFVRWTVGPDGSGGAYNAGDRLLPEGSDIRADQMDEGIDLYACWEQLHLGDSELTWDDVEVIGNAGIAPDFFSTDFAAVRSDLGDDGNVSEANLAEYTKELNINGRTLHAMIADFNHDETADGGIAAITFITYEAAGNDFMEEEGKGVTGWDSSTMRTDILRTVLSAMPSDLRTRIREVRKTANNTAGNPVTSIDRLFLPSVEELFGTYRYAVKP